MRKCEKPSPNCQSHFFWKPNCGNWVFSFWILWSVWFRFQKTIIQHFYRFYTPIQVFWILTNILTVTFTSLGEHLQTFTTFHSTLNR